MPQDTASMTISGLGIASGDTIVVRQVVAAASNNTTASANATPSHEAAASDTDNQVTEFVGL